ncbi:membrane protein insertion efficiency factor YidD [Candidatus Gracilibacteria bacterium]|nr:membrane protein insertion efficiency factor YidD [Candidatus Gracilibacteria bacterium]NJM88038.1 membrane protein insertion efficiency factor YidD [Hydrococcus sp. RU_2_2]NJP19520.1 membrane protein insertion efficiency factor YidD [Hydrococcus sp. CRU_1_1]
MQISNFETFTRKSAIDSINLYQQYLSPRKGFACPHRLLHGEESCSQHVKNLLLNQPLELAIQMSVQRFRDCAAASRTLRQTAEGGCLIIPCCIPL